MLLFEEMYSSKEQAKFSVAGIVEVSVEEVVTVVLVVVVKSPSNNST